MNSLALSGERLIAYNIFKEMKAVASGIVTDFFRDYFMRKSDFEMNKIKMNIVQNIDDLEYYKEKLEQIKRIRIVQNLFSTRMKVDGFMYSDPKI